MIHETVGDDDLRDVIGALIELAKGGDLAAIREALDRLVGKARERDDTPETVRAGNHTQIKLDARELREDRRVDSAAWLDLGKPRILDRAEGP